MRLRGLLVAAAAIAASPVIAGAAAAHGGGAALEVLAAEEVAPGKVALQVRVEFEADGDEATGAIVDVVPTGPGGDPSPEVRLERDGTGAYVGALDLPEPGRWILAVTSSFPPGSTEVPVEVVGVAPVGGGEAAAASEPASRSGPEVLDEPEVGGAEGGSDTTNLVVAAVSGVIGGALGLWVSRRRSARRRAASAD